MDTNETTTTATSISTDNASQAADIGNDTKSAVDHQANADTTMRICPCCKHATLKANVQIPDELMDVFMSCILSNTPFNYTYPLYNGKLNLTVTVYDNDKRKLYNELMRFLQDISQVTDLPTEYHDKIEDLKDFLRCMFPLLRIAIYKGTAYDVQSCIAPVIDTLHKALTAYHANAVKNIVANDIIPVIDKAIAFKDTSDIPVLPLPMIGYIITIHNQMYDILMDSGFDETFWKGIALA